MENAGANGPLGRADDGGDLGAGSLFDLAEHDGHALVERESIERVHEPAAELPLLDVAMGVRGSGLGLPRKSSERSSPSSGGSHVVLRVVDRDRDEKRSKRRVPTKAGDRAGERDEDVLNEVLRRLDVSDEALRERADRDVVLLVHERDRPRIGPLEADDEGVRGVVLRAFVGGGRDEVRRRSRIHGSPQ